MKGATGTMLVNISTSPYLSRLFFRVCEDSKLLVQFLDTCHAEISRQKGTNKGKTLDLEKRKSSVHKKWKVPGSRALDSLSCSKTEVLFLHKVVTWEAANTTHRLLGREGRKKEFLCRNFQAFSAKKKVKEGQRFDFKSHSKYTILCFF